MMSPGLLLGLLPPLLLIALVAWGVHAVRRPGTASIGSGRGVRRFFQYLLLYGLLWVAGSGVAGLLEQLLDRGRPGAGEPGTLALYTAFTVVGVPLGVLVALWTRQRMRDDSEEARSPAWTVYLTAASLTTLGMAMAALHQLLSWATGLIPFTASAPTGVVVWGGLWVAHLAIDRRLVAGEHVSPHRLLGSLVGLVVTAVGAIGVVGDALRVLFGLAPGGALAGEGRLLLPGAVVLAVGLPVWLVYWVLPGSRYRRGLLWLGYVLLGGVGGGLVTATVAASVALHTVLVWLVGEPLAATPRVHFAGTPGVLAAGLVGVLLWGYHRTVLQEGGDEARTEVRRIYEYLIAGIGLVAAATGLMLAVAAVLESLAGPADVPRGGASINTVLAALTALAVGGPVWWLFWRRIEAAVRLSPGEERRSPCRRIYVFLLFGVAGVAVVVALLVGLVTVLQDLFDGRVGPQTLRGVRYAAGVIVAAGLLSAYHWRVYRVDRAESGPIAHTRAPFVLLLGPADPDLAPALERRTGSQVQLWTRADGVGAPWSVEEVAAIVAQRLPGGEDLVIVSGHDGLEVVPVSRWGAGGAPISSALTITDAPVRGSAGREG